MFKTILPHVDGGAHQESRLRAAVLLAGAIPAQRASHGVPVEVAALHIRAPESGALMDMAHDCRAGLLVAGVFGHGYREWGLGGVTRDRFVHAPAPLLTMH